MAVQGDLTVGQDLKELRWVTRRLQTLGDADLEVLKSGVGSLHFPFACLNLVLAFLNLLKKCLLLVH